MPLLHNCITNDSHPQCPDRNINHDIHYVLQLRVATGYTLDQIERKYAAEILDILNRCGPFRKTFRSLWIAVSDQFLFLSKMYGPSVQ